jgi:cytochrome P450
MFEWLARPVAFLDRNHRRYGDTFTMNLAGIEAVVISDPAIIKQVFMGDPDVLHAGESNAAPLEQIVGSNSVLLLDGPEHMRQRKLMLPSFQGERMRSYGDLIAEITEQEVERFPVGRPFGLREHTAAITLEVIMRAVFGVEDAQRLDALRDRLTNLLSFGMNRFALAALAIPVVRQTLGRRMWTSFIEARAAVDEILYQEIAERRNDATIGERQDILSILLQARDDDGNPLTDEELRDELMTLLVAGHETTATSLAWGFDLLLHNREKLDLLKAELAEQPDGGEYLDAVIKETLRLRPVLPAVARKLTEPIELDGRVIPAGARVAPNIYLTHRRPDIYPDPEAFKPERFLDRQADTYSWIPFGGGIRRCLGASFALYEMKVVIPIVLARTNLRAASPRPERVARRAITFAPEHDTMVVVDRLIDSRSDRANPVAA